MATTNTNFYYNTTINGSATAGALSCSSLTNTGTLSSTSAATMGALSCSSVSSLGAINSSGAFSCGANAATVGALSCSTIATSSGIVCGALTSSSQMVGGSITSSSSFVCGSATTGALVCSSLISNGTISSGTNAVTCGAITCSTITASGDIIIYKDGSTSLVFKSSSNTSFEYGIVGHVGNAGELFYDSSSNDICVRNSVLGNRILLGIGSSRATVVIDKDYLRLNRLDHIANAGLFDFRNTYGWGIYCDTTNENSRGNSLDFKYNDYNFNSSRQGTVMSLSATGKVGINTSFGAFTTDALNVNGSIFAQTSVVESISKPARFFNTSGQKIFMALGQNESPHLCAYFSYVTSSNPAVIQDSVGRLGIWVKDDIITWNASGGIGTAKGRVAINKSPETNSPYALDVDGNCIIRGAIASSGAVVSDGEALVNVYRSKESGAISHGARVWVPDATDGHFILGYECGKNTAADGSTAFLGLAYNSSANGSYGSLGMWNANNIITYNFAGHVGINKVFSPDYILDVNGNCRVLGAITSSNLVTSANGLTLGPTASNGGQTNSMMFSIGSTLVQNGQSNEIAFASGAQSVYTTYGAGGSWQSNSDERLKTEIEPSPLGLEFIKAIVPIKFKWNELAACDTKTHHAFSYQQLKKVCEDFNTGDIGLVDSSREYGHVASGLLIAPLVNAVKELNIKVDELLARLPV